jgi:glycosyltransferase involved in cell wall biosynthesis
MPCFNAERYVAGALRSVFAQRWPDLEVIVVDDGSSDRSCHRIEEAFPEVHLLRQANRGAAAARNRGIDNATGDLIAFLDADDYWLPGKLKAQWEALVGHPAARMTYTAWVVWNSGDPEPTDQLVASVAASSSEKRWSGPSGWIYTDLLLDCAVWTSTVLVQRSLVRELGGFEETLPIGEDYDLWLRASRLTEIVRVPRPLALYRMHVLNVTRKAPAENFEARVISSAISRWGYASPDGSKATPKDVDKALARTWHSFAGAHAAVGNWKQAWQGAVAAVRLDPNRLGAWKLLLKSAIGSALRAQKPQH